MGKILSMSGWAQPHDVLKEVTPNAEFMDYSACGTPELLFNHLKSNVYDGVVAWSLGAQLAVRAIKEGALAPKWMVLLAPPLQFVNDEAFGEGMDPVTYGLFREGYAKDATRTASRFNGLLVKGDRYMREILPLLGNHPQVHSPEHWLHWLDDLADQKLSDFTGITLPPTLLIQGKEDVIVPCTQAYAWKNQFPDIELHLMDGMGHTPHHHDADQVRTLIEQHSGKHAL